MLVTGKMRGFFEISTYGGLISTFEVSYFSGGLPSRVSYLYQHTISGVATLYRNTH